jgi:hypothetical protein
LLSTPSRKRSAFERGDAGSRDEKRRTSSDSAAVMQDHSG